MSENGNGCGSARSRFFGPVLVFVKLAFGWLRIDRASGSEEVTDTERVLDDLEDRLPESDDPNQTDN